MKNIKTLITTTILNSMSFTNFTTIKIQSTPKNQQKINTINTNTKTNLKSLKKQLAQKTNKINTKSFHITSITNPNTLHGTTIIYK